jgi:hypothetical protein
MKGTAMAKTLQLVFLSVAFAAALGLAPTQASAANCSFSKKEKIAMVSWIMLIPGAVITGMGCKRDLFNKNNKNKAFLPAEDRGHTELRFLDRRRRAI